MGAVRIATADITIMVQKEVAERLMATPGSKAFGSLSLLLQLEFDILPGPIVPNTAFKPAPKVASQVVKMVPKAKPLGTKAQRDWLAANGVKLFAQRRKTILNNLKPLTPAAQAMLNQAAIDPKLRPEQLSHEQWLTLASILLNRTP